MYTQGSSPESESYFFSKDNEKHIYRWVTNMKFSPYIQKMQFNKTRLSKNSVPQLSDSYCCK